MKNLSELKTSVDGLMNEIEIEIMHGVLNHEYDPQTLKSEKLEATRREIRAKIYKLFLDAAAMHGKGKLPKNVVSNEPQREANARLISSAPDLLEALEDLVEQIQTKGIADEFKFDLLIAAIDKARGDS